MSSHAMQGHCPFMSNIYVCNAMQEHLGVFTCNAAWRQHHPSAIGRSQGFASMRLLVLKCARGVRPSS